MKNNIQGITVKIDGDASGLKNELIDLGSLLDRVNIKLVRLKKMLNNDQEANDWNVILRENAKLNKILDAVLDEKTVDEYVKERIRRARP